MMLLFVDDQGQAGGTGGAPAERGWHHGRGAGVEAEQEEYSGAGGVSQGCVWEGAGCSDALLVVAALL